MKQLNESFPGIYRGEVMDNDDSEMLGRIKVKVHPVFKDIETTDLPWAIPAMSPFQGGDYQNGSFVIPRVGSHVFVMFEAGDPYQPIFFASAHAQQESLSKKDWHLRAQGEVDTINTTKNVNRKTGVVTALGASWDEPVDELGGYPDTAIIHTNAGHLIEVSDTDGKTRIHIYHKSGSYRDMRHNGDVYERIENDCLEIVKGNQKISITGDHDITIEGDKGTKVAGNDTKTITGNKVETIGINKTETITGNKVENISGNKTKTITGNKVENISGNKVVNVVDETITITGNQIVNISGTQTINATGDVTLTSSGIVKILASSILLGIGAVKRLVNETFRDRFNEHLHSGVTTGSNNTGVTTHPMNNTTHLTAEVKAS
jgi:type VI secretion system secreted protein VgrG